MSRFKIEETGLKGLRSIIRRRLGDDRGFLSRIFCSEELANAGWMKPIAQINYTQTSTCGTVRGLHFQNAPHSEMKLVTCIRGEVWDVAVDIRDGSPTFLQWHAERLSGENGRALLIPDGFAHGFQTLTDHVEMLYFHSNSYVAESEGGLHPQDNRLGITWPRAITMLSSRDAAHPPIDHKFTGVVL
jgi:dTDP-4-dehydrorhamnose 3,5-epimerase